MTACVDQVTGLGDYLELEIIVETEAERESALQRIEECAGKSWVLYERYYQTFCIYQC